MNKPRVLIVIVLAIAIALALFALDERKPASASSPTGNPADVPPWKAAPAYLA